LVFRIAILASPASPSLFIRPPDFQIERGDKDEQLGDRRTRNSARARIRAGAEMAMDHAAAEVDHLAAERAAARFDVEAMKVAWAGSRHAVDVADRMARLVASDPVSGCFPRSPSSSSLIPPITPAAA